MCPGQSCSKRHLSWNLQGGGIRLNRRLWTRDTEMVYAHLEQLCFCASNPSRSCPVILSSPLHQNWQSSDANTKLYGDFKPAKFSSHSPRRCGGDWNTTNFYQINHDIYLSGSGKSVPVSQCPSTLWLQSDVEQQQVIVSSSAHLFSTQTIIWGQSLPLMLLYCQLARPCCWGSPSSFIVNLCSATGVTCHSGGLDVRNGGGMSSCLFLLLTLRVSGQGLPLHPGAAASRNHSRREWSDWLTWAVFPG